MKKIMIASLCLLALSIGCKKEDNVSRVVDAEGPTVTLKGDKFISIAVGGTYTDPGATVLDNFTHQTSDVTADINTLDASTPGLYYMEYTAKNANGYITSAARYIAVTNWTGTANLNGNYKRTSNGVVVKLNKKANGLYEVTDMGGANIPTDKIYFTVVNDTTIDVGPQYSESIGAEIEGVSSKLNMQPTDTFFVYTLHAAGYGTASRKFVKQ